MAIKCSCKNQGKKIVALLISAMIWFLGGISLVFCWEEFSPEKDIEEKIPIYIHLGCIYFVGFVISLLTYMVFYKRNFRSWFTHVSFFLYIVFELVLLVNALTINDKFKLKIAIECVIVFVLLSIYTSCVSKFYHEYKDEQRMRQEEYNNRLTSPRIPRGACFRIPLKGPGTSSKAGSSYGK